MAKKIQNKIQNTPDNAKASRAIKIPQQLYRITTDLSKYRAAVATAENIYNPNRYDLLQLYQQTVLDAHVSACVAQRKNQLLSCDFNIYDKAGKEVEDKTLIFETKWFREYLEYVFEVILYGHSLIQFEDVINMGGVEQFKEVELVPRIYVRPESHYVVNSAAAMAPDGIDYLELPYSNWCIGVGKKRDLGLLLKVTPLVIWKKNSLGAWAEFIEKFGSPLRIGKTDSTDEQSVNQMQGMLQNMGVAAWGLFKTDDIIEFVETNHTDSFNVFDKMIERCNSEISKLILGQTMTTDNGSSRSQAEVHKQILDQFGVVDKQFLYTVNNTQLLPLMNRLGFGLDGLVLDIEQEDEFNLEQKSKFDIELLKTGKFTFTPEYIKEKYGTEVIEVKEPIEPSIKNELDKYYS